MYACTSYLLLDLGVSKGESNQGVVGLDNHGLHNEESANHPNDRLEHKDLHGNWFRGTWEQQASK